MVYSRLSNCTGQNYGNGMKRSDSQLDPPESLDEPNTTEGSRLPEGGTSCKGGSPSVDEDLKQQLETRLSPQFETIEQQERVIAEQNYEQGYKHGYIYASKEPAALPPCDICHQPQTQLGAVKFSPTDKPRLFEKTHICVKCDASREDMPVKKFIKSARGCGLIGFLKGSGWAHVQLAEEFEEMEAWLQQHSKTEE